MSLPASIPSPKHFDIEPNGGRFSPGASYLLLGESGHPQQLMAVVQEAVEVDEKCLLISSRPQSVLAGIASRIGFDLPRASKANQVGLLKAPTRDELAAFGDLGLSQAFRDLLRLAESQNARRVVIDDFSSFMQFRVFEAFTTVFRKFVLDAAEMGTTFILSLGEPMNDASEQMVKFVKGQVTETILGNAEIEPSFQENIGASDCEFAYSFEADLRAVREAAGLTLEDIQKRIRIATAIIERFEKGLLIGDPTFKAEYVQTILRSYADALGLGHQRVRAASEASRAGIYRGELHPDYKGGTGTEGKTIQKGQQALKNREIDPSPEATGRFAAVDSPSENAWGAVLEWTIKRFMNRKKLNPKCS